MSKKSAFGCAAAVPREVDAARIVLPLHGTRDKDIQSSQRYCVPRLSVVCTHDLSPSGKDMRGRRS